MTTMIAKSKKRTLPIFLTILAMFFFSKNTFAQAKNNYIRIAKITIDSAKLESYKIALKEEIETSVRVEAGVLSLNAVYEKENPTHVTILEIYADMDAYKSHIQTLHFKKYKDAVNGMVKSLVLTDVLPIAMPLKPIK
jgi:quinol monooxygenase YgiN